MSFRLPLAVLAVSALPILGQNLGSVSLPASLADPTAKVTAALNKNPVTGAYLVYSEGPAVDAQGNLFFAECGGDAAAAFPNRIWKVTPSGQASIFYSADNGSNGMEFDPQGNLVVCLLDTLVKF
jgi:hypothetical protein